MPNLQIFFRRDLGMRKGKIAAQVAHAACAQLLNAMEDQGDVRLLPHPAYQALKQLLDTSGVIVTPVADEAELRARLIDPEQSAIIIDRGLTEFGGVPTLTTAAQGVFQPSPRKAVPMSGADLIARQWFVFSKEKPLPKERAGLMAAIGCLKMMNALLVPPSEGEGSAALPMTSPALRGWLTAGFGKIGMGIRTDAALGELERDLTAIGVKTVIYEIEGSLLLVTSPEFPETVAPVMGRESGIYSSGVLTLL